MGGQRVRAVARGGGALVAGVLLVVLCTLEAGHQPFVGTLIATTAIYAIAATGLDFVVGWIQEISVAQATTMAAGAFAGYPLITSHPLLAFLIAAVSGMAVGAFVGLPAVRVHGFALATYTLVIALAASTLLGDVGAFGGTYGRVVVMGTIFGQNFDPTALTALSVAVMVVGIFVYYLLKRSIVGLSWRAIGQNPRMAGSLAVNLPGSYLLAFATAGLFGGVAGMLYAVLSNYLAADAFSFDLSINILAIVIIGGRGHPLGAVVGSALLTIIDYYLPAAAYAPVILGGLLVVVVWLAPRGVAVYLGLAWSFLVKRVTAGRYGHATPPDPPAGTTSGDPISIARRAGAGG
jgi:branched-chain amino acid transport system permease protein